MNSRIEKLIKQFAKLPRVGGRAAQRIVLALLQDKTGRATALADALADAA
jgi:recombinational DNA repair protein RecR